MRDILVDARKFMLTHTRLLERRIFEVRFDGADPGNVGQVIRAYQNSDGGLGHALEPDVRCKESQPLFVTIGLASLEEVGYRNAELALSICNYLQSVSGADGLVPFFTETVYKSPLAGHWVNSTLTPGLNPTADICGLLHYHGVQHEWLTLATETCCKMILSSPPLEAHTLLGAARLAEYIPDKKTSMNIMDTIAAVLPKASFFIPAAPVETYGLTPLHFAPKPDSACRVLFTQNQIDSHIEDIISKQQPDGGWPISWEAPGPASVLEWRGRWTLDAISRLAAYGAI